MKYGLAFPNLDRYDVHVQDPATGKPIALLLTAATAGFIYGIGPVQVLR
jgi:hypothetical protein